ncbi:unnamed protein product [Laminaria digitata]
MEASGSAGNGATNNGATNSSGGGGVAIHIMTEADVVRTLAWAGSEGWNPGNADAKPFQAADPEGFFISKTEDGEPVASVSAVRYGEDYGFIGLYICAPEFRGRGHGLAVFRHGMDHLEGRVMGLDAVLEQQANYAKLGFEVAHLTLRFEGVGGAVDAPPSLTPTAEGEQGGGLVVEKLGQDNVELVLDFDRGHVPAPRAQFMRTWFANPGHTTLVAMEKGSVRGYGVLRPSAGGARIGPLFADSVKVAELLLMGLAGSTSPKTMISMDIPDINEEAVRLAERLGFSKVFVMARMYRGPAPKVPMDRIFSITIAELGP